MEEMINLWRRSGSRQDDLYGPAVREQVELAIFGSLAPAHPTQAQVMQIVNGRVSTKQMEMATRPWDERLRHEIGVLQQIAQLLATTQVPGTELQRIADDMGKNVPGGSSSMSPPPPIMHVPPPAPSPMSMPMTSSLPPPPPSLPAPPHINGQRPPPTNLPPFAPTLNGGYPGPSPSPHGASQATGIATPMQHTASTPVPTIAPMRISAMPNIGSGIPANVADILRNLNTSGLLSKTGTPDNVAGKVDQKVNQYEEMILSLDIRLESIDLNR